MNEWTTKVRNKYSSNGCRPQTKGKFLCPFDKVFHWRRLIVSLIARRKLCGLLPAADEQWALYLFALESFELNAEQKEAKHIKPKRFCRCSSSACSEWKNLFLVLFTSILFSSFFSFFFFYPTFCLKMSLHCTIVTAVLRFAPAEVVVVVEQDCADGGMA